MPVAKKGERFGGRQKGTPNKINAALKDMILTALHNKGGVAYLEAQADENPTAFLTLVRKVLPLQVNADVRAAVTYHTIERRIVDPAA